MTVTLSTLKLQTFNIKIRLMYLLHAFENGSSAIPLTEIQNLSDHLRNICFAT